MFMITFIFMTMFTREINCQILEKKRASKVLDHINLQSFTLRATVRASTLPSERLKLTAKPRKFFLEL